MAGAAGGARMSVEHFPLAKIGALRVPPKALKHVHVREACAIATLFNDDRKERIIGTSNKGEPHAQLYGWGCNVAKHLDETGWVYFSPLMMGESKVFAAHLSLQLEPFSVYRLHDHAIHWTEDTAPVICLFAGVFLSPQDPMAMAMLQAGMMALTKGLLGAPRVSPGFRVPLRDEIYAATNDGDVRLVSRGIARSRGWLIAQCANCQAAAIKVDRHFPYHHELNRCAKHLEAKAA